MCGTAGNLLDQTKTDAFAQQMLTIINHSGLALMISIGHRVKLFDALAGLSWVSSHQLAGKAGLNERYVREWLAAMASGGIVHSLQPSRWLLPSAARTWGLAHTRRQPQ